MKEKEIKAGLTFGWFTTLRYLGTKKGRHVWLCECICGNKKPVSANSLTSGNTKSCGCLHREACRSGKNYKHGATGSPEYLAYHNMIQRCTNRNNPDYKNYGGRGISVCKRWFAKHGFENFLIDMGPRPLGTSIDRYPNRNGNYEPSNCRWATAKEQNRNKDDVKLSMELAAEIRLRHSRESLTYRELAKKYGVAHSVIGSILHNEIWT
jgi:hypothetical protein